MKLMINHEILDFSTINTGQSDNSRIKEWGIVSNSDKIYFPSVVTKLIGEDQSNRWDNPNMVIDFQTVFDLQFSFFFVYRKYDLHIEPLFYSVVPEETSIVYELNPRLKNELSKSNNFNTDEFMWNKKWDLLSQFLQFNFFVKNKEVIDIYVSDIRKLLFKEDKYKSDADFINKVLKKIINELPQKVKLFSQTSKNNKSRVIFQSSNA